MFWLNLVHLWIFHYPKKIYDLYRTISCPWYRLEWNTVGFPNQILKLYVLMKYFWISLLQCQDINKKNQNICYSVQDGNQNTKYNNLN